MIILLTLFKRKNTYQSFFLRFLVIIIAFFISTLGAAYVYLTLLQSFLLVYILLSKGYSFSDLGLNVKLISKEIKWLFSGLIMLILLLLLPNAPFIIHSGFIITLKHYFSNIIYANIYLVLATIINALYEELIFRGILQKILSAKFPNKFVVIVLVSVIFTLLHVFNAKSPILVIVFFISVILCYIRERGGQIYYSVILHSLWNLLNP